MRRALLVAAVMAATLLLGAKPAAGMTVTISASQADFDTATTSLTIHVSRVGGTGSDAANLRFHAATSNDFTACDAFGAIQWDNGPKTIGHFNACLPPYGSHAATLEAFVVRAQDNSIVSNVLEMTRL